MSLIREVHWYEDAEPPKVCAWCGESLKEGEVFVFEVESEAIRTGEVALVEHESLIGFAGLHAACEECRRGIVANDEKELDDLDRVNVKLRRATKWWLLLAGAFLFGKASTDSGSVWLPLVLFTVIAVCAVATFMALKRLIEYLQSRFDI